nr:phosphoenol pyruvate carboxykinase [Tanacetum cinerariifolium]
INEERQRITDETLKSHDSDSMDEDDSELEDQNPNKFPLISFENGKHLVLAEVKSRASALPFKVLLDKTEGSPMDDRRSKKKEVEERKFSIILVLVLALRFKNLAAFRTDEIKRTPTTPQVEMRVGMSYLPLYAAKEKPVVVKAEADACCITERVSIEWVNAQARDVLQEFEKGMLLPLLPR